MVSESLIASLVSRIGVSSHCIDETVNLGEEEAKSEVNMITCWLEAMATEPSGNRAGSLPTHLSRIGNGCIRRITSSEDNPGCRFTATAMSLKLIAVDRKKGWRRRE